MSIKSLLAALVVSLSLAAPVLAGPFEDGRTAYNRGDYETALRLWLPLAEQGDAIVQFNLGGMYYAGAGVLKDDAKAMAWFRKAAEQGNAEAQINLGAIYLTSKSLPQDYVEAHKWFNLSAAQGGKNAEKYRDLLANIMTPDQITEAQRLAREWKPKKQEEAEKAKREAEAKQKALRQAAAKKMTPAQIAEAQRLAREWKPKK